MNSPNHPFKFLRKSDPGWSYAACEDPSYLRRSVLQFRRKVQRVTFSSEVTQLVTVRRIYGGPCCSSVVKFRESIPKQNFRVEVFCNA